MQGLTQRQHEVLEFIKHSIVERGYPPTLREIGAHMGIRSTNGVNDHLRALERKGYLTREDMKSRALRPRDEEAQPGHEALHSDIGAADEHGWVDVAVLGRVAAGLPMLAEENIVDSLRIESKLVRGGQQVFGLKVVGDSMIEAGIFNGDYIFVQRQASAERGAIVVALIGDEATVKYFFPERDYVRFQPANSQMAPILVRATDFRPTMIIGVVIGVYRKI